MNVAIIEKNIKYSNILNKNLSKDNLLTELKV